ncbi:unnamed protein product [Prunus armeniaca]|uniref:Uncharacterized protein n=1 Tax=Prunus armeniaca TaxID=36596 RepID=A0A6J5UZM1_PRUAR|nr:unnamed protein product [Prunus armeniaca]
MCCLATHDLAATLNSGMNLSSLCLSAISRKMIICGLAHRDTAVLHIIQHWNVWMRNDCTWHFKDSHHPFNVPNNNRGMLVPVLGYWEN